MAKTRDRYLEMRQALAKEKEAATTPPPEWEYSLHDAIHDSNTNSYGVCRILYTPGTSHNLAEMVVTGLPSLASAIASRDELNIKENIKRMRKQFPKTKE